MTLWSKFRGTAETLWQIGLAGPQWKNNTGVLEATNAANNALVIVRGLDPVGLTDLVTLGANQASRNDRNVFVSPLAPGSAGFLTVTTVAYFVYLGKVPQAMTPKFVEFHVSTIAATVTTTEAGIFSSPAAPNKAGQSLTKIATGATNVVTATGVNRNTTAFAVSVPAGTFLWAGYRCAATTPPTIWGVGVDMSQGQILSTAAAAAFSTAGPWTAALIAAATGMQCPDLRGSLV